MKGLLGELKTRIRQSGARLEVFVMNLHIYVDG